MGGDSITKLSRRSRSLTGCRALHISFQMSFAMYLDWSSSRLTPERGRRGRREETPLLATLLLLLLDRERADRTSHGEPGLAVEAVMDTAVHT